MTVQRPVEALFFLPGYGEDPDMVRPLTDALADKLGLEVYTAHYYRRNDHRYYPEGLPSRELAARSRDQFERERERRRERAGRRPSSETNPIVAVGHSMGARVIKHMTGIADRVLLAPEGLEAGGRGLAQRFTADILQRAAFGPWDERVFAWRQIGNLASRPGESIGLASEMVTEGTSREDIRGLSPTLLVSYEDDTVIRPGSMARPLVAHAAVGVQFERLPGGHYEPFIHPEPTVSLIEKRFKNRL